LGINTPQLGKKMDEDICLHPKSNKIVQLYEWDIPIDS